MQENIKFKGVVLYERYYNEDSFWGVFNVKTLDELPYSKKAENFANPFEDDKPEVYYVVTVAGKVQHLCVGSEYEFTASAQFSPKYNSWNYVPESAVALTPTTFEASKLFLESILTKQQAAVLIEKYPNVVTDVVSGKDNVDVSKLKGIGEVTWIKLKNKIIDNYVISDIIAMLQPVGITYTAIKSLLKWEPNSAVLKEKIQDNPYVIIDAKGFGFDRVDKFALKLDPSLEISSKRLFAFIKHYLRQAANEEGHTWIDLQAVCNGIVDYIPQCKTLFDNLFMQKESPKYPNYFIVDNGKIGLSKYKDCEENIYSILKDLDSYKFHNPIDVEGGITRAELALGYTLTEEQKNIVRMVNDHNVVIFTGSAGTGKSSSARAILESFKGSHIACCSLSAKAAQRIKEATGFEASTIHRLLGYDGNNFIYNAANRLPADIVFIDECSMMNCDIYYSIISAVKEGAKVIMCGDNLQLPPIGAGNVFSDLLEKSNTFSVSKLTKVHRQAEKSGILNDANAIRKGIMPIRLTDTQITTGDLQDMMYVFRDQRDRIRNIAVNQFVKIARSAGINNVVLAVPRKDTVINSALELNKCIQSELIDTSNTSYIEHNEHRFYIGDRVLQIENDGDRNVYNGEVGFVENVFSNVRSTDVCMTVRFKDEVGDKYVNYTQEDLKTITLGYAMTVHKLQGSEYPYTIVVIDNTHYTLLDTCLLYTAVTRAKKKCLLVSELSAFKQAMSVNKNIKRQTWLKIKEDTCIS